MKTTTHGGLPASVRDQGVFAEPSLLTEDAAGKVESLTARKAHADERLAAVFAKVQAGTIGAEEFASLQELAAEATHLARALERAQRAAAKAEQRRAERAGEELRANLEAVLAKAAKHKQEFTAAYEATCLALGSYCAAIDEAIKLSSSWAQVSKLDLLDPRRTVYGNRIALLNSDLDPRPVLTQAGLRGTVQHGWNLQFPIVPLHETRKEKL